MLVHILFILKKGPKLIRTLFYLVVSGDCHDLMKAVFKIKGTGSSISGRSEKALGLVGKENPEKRSRGKDFGRL